MPVFLPVSLVTASVFFEISRDKKEYCYSAGLQIPKIEPFL
jgi:hypothetical protein